MENVFGKRLRSARVRATLSQSKLIEKMGGVVSKNAISKYERGEMLADSMVLLALSKALGVKPDYFFRPFTIEIRKIEFRKKNSLSVKETEAIKQKATDRVERYIEIEEFLNIKAEFVNPLEGILIEKAVDVEQAVEKLLSVWELGFNALPNAIDMLENKEVKVIEVDAPDGFDGFSGWADDKIPVIVINRNYTIERKRLTALHELGHLLLGFNPKLSQKEIERFCFRFAGAMLIPERTFKKEIGAHRSHFSISELIAIKENYGISIQAIMARARDLNVITQPQYETFRKWINKNKTEDGLGTYCGQEQSFRFKQLVHRAAAEEIISLSKAANLSNLKLAEFRKEFIAL